MLIRSLYMRSAFINRYLHKTSLRMVVLCHQKMHSFMVTQICWFRNSGYLSLDFFERFWIFITLWIYNLCFRMLCAIWRFSINFLKFLVDPLNSKRCLENFGRNLEDTEWDHSVICGTTQIAIELIWIYNEVLSICSKT